MACIPCPLLCLYTSQADTAGMAAAYNELRNEEALNKFGERYANLNKTQKKEIRKLYPQKISEAEPKKLL